MSIVMNAIGVCLAVAVAYSFIAGIAARLLKQTEVAHVGPGEYGCGGCPAGRGAGPCECGLWGVWAAIWPLVLVVGAIVFVFRHVVYEPLAAAARIGYFVGRPRP